MILEGGGGGAHYISVREITKSSSTFSATNIISNIVWLLQLHDTIQTKSILVPNLVAFFSQNETNVWFFDYHLLTCSGTHMFDAKYRYVFVE